MPAVSTAATVHGLHVQTLQDRTVVRVTKLTQEMEEHVIWCQVSFVKLEKDVKLRMLSVGS